METTEKKFDHAINEVVLSIHFEALDNLLAPHLGEIWQKFKNDGFTKITEHPPVRPVIEPSENPRRETEYQINVPDLPRIWFTHSDDSQILQVQRDRFTFNWRKTNSGQKYPGYSEIFKIFENFYGRFRQIIRKMEIGLLTSLHYELSYVYEFPQGDRWNTLNDIGKILRLFVDFQQSDSFWSGANTLNLRVSFPMTDSHSWLHLGASNRVKSPEQQQTLQIDFRALNFRVNTDTEMNVWFQSAHDQIREKIDSIFTDDKETNV